VPYKYCSKNHPNGVRSAKCKTCDEPFNVKSKKIKKFVPSDVEWTTLERDDVVRVYGGSGPWFEGENGLRQYLGVPSGKYEVMSIEKEGFFVNDGVGRLFVYMGEVKPGVVGTKEPHKIKLIRKAQNAEKED
jgi:hypothetical protein